MWSTSVIGIDNVWAWNYYNNKKVNLKEELNHRIFDIVKNASEKLGYESFVVGGWVRDLLLNNKNKKDIDFVCVGSGIKLAKEVQNLIPNSKISTYSNFGTATFAFSAASVRRCNAWLSSVKSIPSSFLNS